MTVYTNQLSSVPYAPSLNYSQLLAGQPSLYDATNAKCGNSFLSGDTQAAGGLATSAAPHSADGGFAMVGSAIVAVAAGAAALL
jgi:hypothetical protein